MIQWARGLVAATVGRTRRLVTRCVQPLSQVTSTSRSKEALEDVEVWEKNLQGHTLGQDKDDDKNDKIYKVGKVRQLSHHSRPALINNTSQLAAVFLLEATLVTSAATWAGGAWITHMYGAPRPDAWEVFGGHAEISLQASRAGYLAMQPLDILRGCDLRENRQREEALRLRRVRFTARG